MKTIRITLTKEGAEAVGTFLYHFTDWPLEARWTGDRKAFRFADGSLLECWGPLERLEEIVAHQTGQCGASFRIEDLGGEAMMWTDEVLG